MFQPLRLGSKLTHLPLHRGGKGKRFFDSIKKAELHEKVQLFSYFLSILPATRLTTCPEIMTVSSDQTMRLSGM